MVLSTDSSLILGTRCFLESCPKMPSDVVSEDGAACCCEVVLNTYQVGGDKDVVHVYESHYTGSFWLMVEKPIVTQTWTLAPS